MKKILFVCLWAMLGFVACEDDENGASIGTISGVQKVEPFVDSRDGKSYECVEIGDQIWFAENLAYVLAEGQVLNCRTWGESYMGQAEVIDALREPFKEAIQNSGLQDPEGLGLWDRPSMKYPTWVNNCTTFDEVIANAEADPVFSEEWIEAFKITRDTLLASAAEEHLEAAERENGNYAETYGMLYSYEGALKAIPTEGGWRLPTDEDWKKLERYLGMSEGEIAKTDAWRGDVQGAYLKEGEHGIGFNALYAGGKMYRPNYQEYLEANTYSRQGQNAYFWVDEKVEDTDSTYLGMIRSVAVFTDQILRTTTKIANDEGQPTLFSVRLVKDK